MNEISKWDYDEDKIKIIKENIKLFEKICNILENKSWFLKMIERESRKKNRYDLLNVLIKIDDHYSKNFSIKLLAKCIILSLCSQELRDSSGLRYVLGNKCCMMFLNTLIKFMEELGFYKMNFKIILKTVVMKCIMFLEICEILKTNTIYVNKKKVISVESLKSNLEFNDDFRFQKTKYSVYQNLVCEYEELELNDLVIVCKMYEFNQPFLIKNIRNMSHNRNDLTDIFELINNESIVDVRYYEESLNESIKDKLQIIDKIRSNNVDNCEQKIKNIERLILKKKKFLEIIRMNNRIFFMKKICFRSRFYDISELGVTNSKEIRYAIKYENFSINEINDKIIEIKNTIYYDKIRKYFRNLTLKEYYLKKFKDFDKNGVLAICLCIVVTIGMEFKNEMIRSNILTNIENFIEIGEKWLKTYIEIGKSCLDDIEEWEKRVYLKKLFEYLDESRIYEGMIINKDYSSSVFFNMVRMFSNDDKLCRAFNVGECDMWSCGYTFLINIIKKKLGRVSDFENDFLTKKNLKRALMCQPYNVGKISAKSYMKENLDMVDYNESKEEYDKLIDKVINVLCDLKENQLFKREFDKLIKEIIDNNYILKLSDIEISMSYNKILKEKRIIVKYKKIKKTMLVYLKSDDIDLRKTKRAMCANIMHSIDAFELRTILKQLKKEKGKNINAIHDCVICTVFDFFRINDLANRQINYISRPKINIIEKKGYSIYIFS